ncbi:MAG: YceI family protein [Luteibaculaceae bacterium]
MSKLSILPLLLCSLLLSLPEQKSKEKPQNTVAFTIKKGLWNVSGHFTTISNQVNFDPNHLTGSTISGSILVNSIQTGNTLRNEHLLRAEWFYAEKFSTLSIQSINLKHKQNDTYTGLFKVTIKGISKTEEIEFTYLQDVLYANFTITLSDYKLSTNKPIQFIIANEALVSVQLKNGVKNNRNSSTL